MKIREYLDQDAYLTSLAVLELSWEDGDGASHSRDAARLLSNFVADARQAGADDAMAWVILFSAMTRVAGGACAVVDHEQVRTVTERLRADLIGTP